MKLLKEIWEMFADLWEMIFCKHELNDDYLEINYHYCVKCGRKAP